jgi:FkbM family methyltransferase
MIKRAKQSLGRLVEIYRMEGMRNVLSSVRDFAYYRVVNLFRRLQYRLSGSTTKIEIGGTVAEFQVKTYTEFIRFWYLQREEENVIEDFLQNISTGDVFFDVGANVGLYTCLAGKILSHDDIVAFEPHPMNTESLKENLRYNSVSASIESIGLADEQGEFRLKESGTEAGEGRHHLSTDDSEAGIAIQVDTLDSVVRSTGQSPSVVKIDVEGAEMDVLRGGSDTFSSNDCRLLYCEIHPDKLEQFGSSREEVIQTIEEFGFQTTILDEKGEGVLMVRGKK